MNSVVIGELISHLSILNPAVFDVSAKTIARYRLMAGIPKVQHVSLHRAKLLIAALLFRPSNSAELAKVWGQNRKSVEAWFVKGLIAESIEITRDVKGSELRQVIFDATGVHLKCNETLKNYAKELAVKYDKPIQFHDDFEVSAALATAFARMAVEKRYAKKHGGLKTAFKRWGYVPDVQIQAV